MNPLNTQNLSGIIKEICTEIDLVSNNVILQQLNSLVSRGLLVVNASTPVLIQGFNDQQLRITRAITLELKDKEYIKQLEIENKKMKEQLYVLKEVMGNVEIFKEQNE